MTAYGIQAPPHAGLTLTMTTPAGTANDTAPTGDHYGLLVNNFNPGVLTVTLPIAPTYDGLTVNPRTVTIPGTLTAGSLLGGFAIIPMPSAVYGVAPQVIDYTPSAGSVAVAAIRIP